MDARTTMIIAKGKFVTTDVTDCIYHKENHKWEIVFKSGRSFFYNQQNVLCLKNPRNLDPQKYQVCRKGKILDNIETILSFSAENEEYWHLVFSTGYEHDYSCRELQVERSIFENSRAKKVFDYLKEAADVISVRAEDQTAILTKQYEKIDFLSRESAAAVYLDPSEYEEGTNLRSEAPIFPFGCNESQFMAVTNALSNRISVIEGPPGTGKTQTILNIIANLVLQGKTVQVVSNNNSAIENVQEKLSSTKYQMDFFVALLGKDQRKEEFLQKSEPVRLNKYLSEAGVCSRREADRLIETGRVTVDGQRAQTGMRIVPGQVVKVGNKVVSKQDEMIVLAVNKPRGIVCTEERRERDSIVRFLNYPVRVTYIGRLDKDSHGLLLMTNNGDIINKMMRAANKHEKEYKVTVDKEITEDFLKKMAAGVPILDTVTRPCTVKKIGKYTFSIILTQGLNRQIRRMCEALGYEVKDLLRVRVMNITLDGLKDGQYRKLTDQELNELYDQLKDSSALPGGKYQEQWAATQDNRTRHGKGKK